jgi:hypothetical protein
MGGDCLSLGGEFTGRSKKSSGRLLYPSHGFLQKKIAMIGNLIGSIEVGGFVKIIFPIFEHINMRRVSLLSSFSIG